MSVDRTKLYAEVWAEPMTTVAKRYDVSSSFLARVCERLGVPRPPRGFWAQRAVGIKLKQPPLPDPGSELEWARDGSEPRRQPMSASRPRGRRAKDEHPGTHSLLVNAKAHFERARPDSDGSYVRPYKRNVVDIFVSRDALERATETANTLFLALEDAGQHVVLAPEDYRHRRTTFGRARRMTGITTITTRSAAGARRDRPSPSSATCRSG
jgi:hypothetical protein